MAFSTYTVESFSSEKFFHVKFDLPMCEIFRTKKTQLFHYNSKTKGFYFRIIIKQFIKCSHKISQIGK